jgi:hypothetical protein
VEGIPVFPVPPRGACRLSAHRIQERVLIRVVIARGGPVHSGCFGCLMPLQDDHLAGHLSHLWVAYELHPLFRYRSAYGTHAAALYAF